MSRCPQCLGSALEAPSGAATPWRCPSCGTRFPEVAGIPWLFAEPEFRLGEWRQRYRLLSRESDNEQARLRQALAGKTLGAATRQRLQRLLDGHAAHQRALAALLAPLDLPATVAREETLLALRTRVPLAQDLTSYYVNLHRDWVWGDEENERSLALVRDMAGARPLGRVLVLGAGGGRLAYDVHQQLGPDETVALDLNPLLLLVAARVTGGDSVELVEFPIAPQGVADVAVTRRLAAPAPARAGLGFVFADALRAPFADASFDTILTPWFVDIVPQDFAEVAARINRLLRPGGAWLNFGSLSFAQRDISRCYSREEVLEMLVQGGYRVAATREVTLPYMRSPASRHSRLEAVFAFAAGKESQAPAIEPSFNLPAWLADETLPVPLLEHFETQALANRIYAFVMALIDGRRGIREIAQYLVEQRLMQAAEAKVAVRSFLVQLYEESRRRTRF